jgi:hypothetical protein
MRRCRLLDNVSGMCGNVRIVEGVGVELRLCVECVPEDREEVFHNDLAVACGDGGGG